MPNDENQAITDLLTPYRKLLEAGGVTGEFLVKQIWDELHADKISLQKIKGQVKVKDIESQGAKVVARSKKRKKDADGNPVSEVVETIVAVNEVAWDVRQKARMDAHRIRGDYPADAHIFPGKDGKPQEIGGSLNSLEAASRLVFLIGEAMKRKNQLAVLPDGNKQQENDGDTDYGNNNGG